MSKYETYPMPEGAGKENQEELTRQRLEALKTQKEIEEGVDTLFEGATRLTPVEVKARAERASEERKRAATARLKGN